MDDLYGLTGEQIDRLRRMLEEFEGGSRLKPADGARAISGAAVIETYLALTTSTISAAATVTTAITQLNGAISDSQTTITVDSIADFPDRVFVVRIDSEDILVLAAPGISTIQIERGYNGTSPAAHSDNADVNLIVFTLGRGTAYISKAMLNPDEDYDLNEDEHREETIYNASTSTIASGERVHVLLNPLGGIYIVTKTSGGSVSDWSTSTPGILNVNSVQTGKGQKRSEIGTPAAAAGWQISHTQSDTEWKTGIIHGITELPLACYSVEHTVDPRFGGGGYFSLMKPLDEVASTADTVFVFREINPVTIAAITTSVTPTIVDGSVTAAFTIPALDGTVTVEIGNTSGLTAGDTVIILGTTTEHGDDAYLSGVVDSVTNGTDFVLQLKGIQKGADIGDEMAVGSIAYRVQYLEGCAALAYVPGDAGDWDSTPETIQEALDELADRATTGPGVAEGGTGSDLSATGPGMVIQAATGDPLTVVQEADYGALGDSTGGTPGGTLNAVSGTGDDGNINDNFASIAVQLAALRAVMQATKQMA
jgi:hypothetical protein